MNNTNVATVRTGVNVGVNTAIIAAVVWVVENLTDLNIDTTSPAFVLGVGAVVTVGYRASLELSARFPWLGRVLFGIDAPPKY